MPSTTNSWLTAVVTDSNAGAGAEAAEPDGLGDSEDGGNDDGGVDDNGAAPGGGNASESDGLRVNEVVAAATRSPRNGESEVMHW